MTSAFSRAVLDVGRMALLSARVRACVFSNVIDKQSKNVAWMQIFVLVSKIFADLSDYTF